MTIRYYLPSQKCIGVCKLMMGDYAHQFSYINDHLGRTLIQCTYYGLGSNQHEALERASILMKEGYGVQTFNEKDLIPYGITQSGKLWVQHKKGHDHYTFDFTGNFREGLNCIEITWPTPVGTISGERALVVSKIVLVGEGNAIRKTRRWIKRQLTDGKIVFNLQDLAEIKKRIHQYQTTILLVVNKGYVIDLAKAEMVDRRKASPSKTESLLLERTVVDVAGACLTGKNPTPVEVALNNVFAELSQ